jgi:ankyrin repeat protein
MASRLTLPTLFQAIKENRSNTVVMILQIEAINNALAETINGSDDNGNTAIMVACYFGRVQMAIQLVQLGANLWQENKLGVSAMTIANSKHPHIVEILMSIKQ